MDDQTFYALMILIGMSIFFLWVDIVRVDNEEKARRQASNKRRYNQRYK